MTTNPTDNLAMDDELLSEEPMMFPYLLDLESDTEPSTEETFEETFEEVTTVEQTVKHPTESTAPAVSTAQGTTKLTRANSAPNPTSCDFTTAISTTALAVGSTPISVNISTEVVDNLNKTLSLLRKQLTEAREDIMDLRQIAFQNDVRAREYELRLTALENPTPSSTSIGTSTEENTDTDCAPPPAKRMKMTTTNPAGTYKGKKPFCSQCTRHHEGSCVTPCGRCKLLGHQIQDCKVSLKSTNPPEVKLCFKCGNPGHLRAKCQLLTVNKATGMSLHDN